MAKATQLIQNDSGTPAHDTANLIKPVTPIDVTGEKVSRARGRLAAALERAREIIVAHTAKRPKKA